MENTQIIITDENCKRYEIITTETDDIIVFCYDLQRFLTNKEAKHLTSILKTQPNI